MFRLITRTLLLGSSLMIGGAWAAQAEPLPTPASAPTPAPISEPQRLVSYSDWTLRYVLKLDAPYFFDIRSTRGKKRLAEGRAGPHEIEAVAQGVRTYVVENSFLEREEVFAALLLEFNRSGELRSPYAGVKALQGRSDQDGEVTLVSTDAQARVFSIGDWEAPQPSRQAKGPALCTKEDAQRYSPDFKPSSVLGRFGCREWRDALEDSKRPYIDVSAYEIIEDPQAKADRKGKKPQQIIATIKPVLGWGRFDLPPKPVIGRHGQSWFCLHDCPDGDLPGFIPNIKTWAARNGWPLPGPSQRATVRTQGGKAKP